MRRGASYVAGRGIGRAPECAKMRAHFNEPCARRPMSESKDYKSWMCLICGFVYDEEKGLPDEGIAPGTRWEDVPMNWTCPECGAPLWIS